LTTSGSLAGGVEPPWREYRETETWNSPRRVQPPPRLHAMQTKTSISILADSCLYKSSREPGVLADIG
jgi:hypothetical protein